MVEPREMIIERLNENRENIDIISLIVSASILFISIQTFVYSLTLALMGGIERTLFIATVILIILSMVLLFLSGKRFNYLFLSLFSGVYLVLTGLIYFRFLPAMKDLADSYEPVNKRSFPPVPGDFDPTSVDFVFYERVLLFLMVFFLVTTIFSASLLIYNEIKIKKDKPHFKVVQT